MSEDVIKMQSKILKALSNPIRLKILAIIGNDRRCQCEIVPKLKKAQSTISQHLDKLVKNDILQREQEGLKVFYKLKNKKTLLLLETVKEIAKENLEESIKLLKEF